METPFTILPSTGYKNTSFQIVSRIDNLKLTVSSNGIAERTLTVDIDTPAAISGFTSVGRYDISCTIDGVKYERSIHIADAYRYGASEFKSAFVFDDLDHAFILMKDRMFIYHEPTRRLFEENNISPSEIRHFGGGRLLLITHLSDGEEGLTNLATYDLSSMRIVDELRHHYHAIFISDASNRIWCKDTANNDIFCCKVEADGRLKELVRFQGVGQYCLNADKTHIIAALDDRVVVTDLLTLEQYSLDKASTTAVDREAYCYELEGTTVRCSNELLGYRTSFRFPEEGLHVEDGRFIHIGDGFRIPIDSAFETMVSERMARFSIPAARQYRNRVYYPVPESERIQQVSNDHQIFPTLDGVFVMTKRTTTIFSDIRCDKGKEDAWSIQPYFSTTSMFSLAYRCPDRQNIIHQECDDISVVSHVSNLLTYKAGKSKYAAIGADTQGCEDPAPDQTITAPDQFQKHIPGDLLAVSPGHDRLVTKSDGKYILSKRIKDSDRYEDIELHIGENGFSESYLSPDGYRLVLLNQNNEYELFDIDKNTTVKYFSEKFVAFSQEGNLIFKDDHRRTAKMIDPSTFQDITPSDYKYYRCLSPDGKLYSHLTTYIRFYDRLEQKFIDPNTVTKYREDLDIPISLDLKNDPTGAAQIKMRIEENRKQIYERYTEAFNARNIRSHSDVTSSAIVRTIQYIKIGIVGTDRVAEIELPADLTFFNYGAFSYDNQYFGCVGKPSSKGWVLLSKIDYDPVNQTISILKTVESRIPRYAAWVCGFSKTGYFATYDSMPDTYLFKCDDRIFDTDDIMMTPVPNRNFLCFSPSGRYIAMSEQGYSPITLGGYGHQESKAVHIARTETGEIFDSYTCHGDRIKEKKKENVAFVAFSEDEKRLMSMSADGVVIVRNLHYHRKPA